jgi:hypothetical protein
MYYSTVASPRCFLTTSCFPIATRTDASLSKEAADVDEGTTVKSGHWQRHSGHSRKSLPSWASLDALRQQSLRYGQRCTSTRPPSETSSTVPGLSVHQHAGISDLSTPLGMGYHQCQCYLCDDDSFMESAAFGGYKGKGRQEVATSTPCGKRPSTTFSSQTLPLTMPRLRSW